MIIMKFGNCVDLIAVVRTGANECIEAMDKAGFNFIEANLTSISTATKEELRKAKELLETYALPIPVCNCMFPKDIRIAGSDKNPKRVWDYVANVFPRARELGVEKVVLGSDKSRQLPEGYPSDQAYDEFIDLVGENILPLCEKNDMVVMIEPLRKPCNFINTLADGMRIVRGVGSPYIRLIADTIHMITSGEDPTYVHNIVQDIFHVHVSDWERDLPVYRYSPELTAVLREIKASGYSGDYSFEAAPPKTEDDLQKARILLYQKMVP